ncbi:hypothetical protein ACSBR1_033336 [Camellia fascicularis]
MKMNKMRAALRSTSIHNNRSLEEDEKEATIVAGEGQRKRTSSSDARPNRRYALLSSHVRRAFPIGGMKEIDAGNRPHISITPNGYHSLSKTFEAATERLHELKQLKNKYNLLKSEWHAWSKLLDCRKGPTGIGFDQATDKFNALPEWWAKMKKDQNLGPSGFDAERLHWGYVQNKHITRASALASSMDDLVNSVKTQSKELTVNHIADMHSHTMGQAVHDCMKYRKWTPPIHFSISE